MIARLFKKSIAQRPIDTARIPDGQRVYAIGDIHGRNDLFQQLLAKIDAELKAGKSNGSGPKVKASRRHTSNRYSSSGRDSFFVHPAKRSVKAGFTYSPLRPVSGCVRTTGCSYSGTSSPTTSLSIEARFFEDAPPAQKPTPWRTADGFAGRFHPQKDFPMLLRAFAQLRQRRNARLVMLGAKGLLRSIG